MLVASFHLCKQATRWLCMLRSCKFSLVVVYDNNSKPSHVRQTALNPTLSQCRLMWRTVEALLQDCEDATLICWPLQVLGILYSKSCKPQPRHAPGQYFCTTTGDPGQALCLRHHVADDYAIQECGRFGYQYCIRNFPPPGLPSTGSLEEQLLGLLCKVSFLNLIEW